VWVVIVLGAVIGAAFGSTTENSGFWLAIGVAIGAGHTTQEDSEAQPKTPLKNNPKMVFLCSFEQC
jgi:hypothetical protein